MATSAPPNSRTWQENSTPGAAVSRQLHLIRHGQSVWNVSKRIQGQAHSPQLTRLGIAQVRRTARTLEAKSSACQDGQRRSQLILTSDLMRARQSAHILAANHGVGPHIPVVTDTRLREQHAGTMQGKTPNQLQPEDPPANTHIADVRWGGGESLQDVADRLGPLVAELTDDFATCPQHGDVVLVSHGITLAVLQALLDGKNHYEIDWTPWPNATCRSWTLTP